MQPMLNIAIRAARNAGNIISRAVHQMDSLQVRHKGQNDFVTEVDNAAEQEIISVLRKAYPSHGILAEESGADGHDDYLWIIDPLDGTTNFLHNFPHYSISIALQYRGKIQYAVIYDPLREELFTASKGGGAQLNNRRMRVSKINSLNGALLGTGFPFKQQQNLEIYLRMFSALFPPLSGIRRGGSAALDLAYVAAGRLDGFWEIGLQIWDIAAGILLIEEAGGIISNFSGNMDFAENNNHIIAGNIKTYPAIVKTLRPYIQKVVSTTPELKTQGLNREV